MLDTLLSVLRSEIPSSFPFRFEKPTESYAGTSLFKRARAVSKSGKEATAFIFEKKASHPPEVLFAAQHVFKRACSLRHPSILAVQEVLETSSNLYIVCEASVPLSEYLRQNGIHLDVARIMIPKNSQCLHEGLTFMHNAGTLHRGISVDSIFVCADGQWKIGLTELGCALGNPTPIADSPSPLKSIYDASSPTYIGPFPVPVNSLACDWYQLAALTALVWRLCQSPSKDLGAMRWGLTANKAALKGNVKHYVDALLKATEHFDLESVKLWTEDPLIPLINFFQNLALKNSWDLEKFLEVTLPRGLSNLESELEVVSVILLSKLAHFFIGSDSAPAIDLASHVKPLAIRLFTRLLIHAKRMPKELFDRMCWEALDRLYQDPERATRFQLLQAVDGYAPLLDAVQTSSITREVLGGLGDSSSELRDATLRGLAKLLPKLQQEGIKGTMNEAISKIGALITQDSIPTIRTNATVCLGKLASILTPNSLHELIGGPMIIASRDSFVACRLAGLSGMKLITPHVSNTLLASTYLPAICNRIVDSDLTCKQLAYASVQESLREIALRDPELLPKSNDAQVRFDSATSSEGELITPSPRQTAAKLVTPSAWIASSSTRAEPAPAETRRQEPAQIKLLHAETAAPEPQPPHAEEPPARLLGASASQLTPAPARPHLSPPSPTPPPGPPLATPARQQPEPTPPSAADAFWSEVNECGSATGPTKRSLAAKRRGRE